MSTSDSKFIDDRNPSIQYIGESWYRKGLNQDFLNTATISKSKGDVATLNFTGSLISVYARLNYSATTQNTTISSYQIDEGPISNVTRIPATTTYRTSLFQSDSLPFGNHTLVITNETDDLPLILDFFMVSSGGSATASPTAFSMASSSTSGPANVSNSQVIKKSISKATTIGGIIGGVVILFIGLAAFWWRKRSIHRSLGNATLPGAQQSPTPHSREPYHSRFRLYSNATADTSVSPFLASLTPDNSISRFTELRAPQPGSNYPEKNEIFYALGSIGRSPAASESYTAHPTIQSTTQTSIVHSNPSRHQSDTLPLVAPPPYHPRISLQKNRIDVDFTQ